MIEIIPSINCPYKDFECVRVKADAVKNFANFVQVDVADGKFTHGKSWGEVGRWKELNTLCGLEVHLMVEQPERYIAEWLAAGVKRIIVHYESICEKEYRVLSADPDELFADMIGQCEDAGSELALAINAETTLKRVGNYLRLFSSFLLMAQAYPGPAGQPFLPLTLPKISELRENFPDARIEVDGGMNGETARLAARAGANALVVGTYLFASPDIEKTYNELRNLA